MFSNKFHETVLIIETGDQFNIKATRSTKVGHWLNFKAKKNNTNLIKFISLEQQT